MADGPELGLWQRYSRWSSDMLDRSLPVLILIVLSMTAAGLLALAEGLRRGEPRAMTLGATVAALGLLGLMTFLYVEIQNIRRKHQWAVRYVRSLRDYAVTNIEPLRATLEALQDVETEQPPAEVPQQRQNDLDERPLGTKERRTLLVIIHVLLKEAQIDDRQRAKAAGTIQSRAELLGLRIGETTIEEVLKKIPDAITARSK